MKKGFLRNVLDTIRSNQTNQQTGGVQGGCGAQSARTADYGGQLKSQHFALSQVARHGFPEQPTALAYDPVQKLAAIGTKSGALRVFGRPGVDIWAQHKPEYAITHIRFVVNQGAIITVTADESIHLWSLRGPNLKLQLSASGGSSSSASSCSPPAPSANSPGPGAQAAASYHHHHQRSGHFTTDSGAQPGDPDYHLSASEQLSAGLGDSGNASGNSPTNFDKNNHHQQQSGKSSRQHSKQPQILHTLKFQREHITCLHQTLMSKWLYIGTERGNVHVANVETFELSGYSIAWNKAIELSRKTHPGAIIQLCECPQDSNKLLIGYESGCIVLWDLKNRNAEGRYYNTENLLYLSWHYEGKQFVAAHGDGSLVTWQTRSNARPAQILQPHAKLSGPIASTEHTPAASESSSVAAYLSGNQQQLAHHHPQTNSSSSSSSAFARALNNELYRPINKVEWKTSKSNEQFLLFSGGLPFDGLGVEQQQHHHHQAPANSAAADLSTCPTSQQQQFLKTSATASPHKVSASISPSISPGGIANSTTTAESAIASKLTRQSFSQQQQAAAVATGTTSNYAQLRQVNQLKSTSLTVMYGKSITVLEMDDTIIDFITVTDSSPYENDASDPFVVIVLLSNDLILIDLTSSGYPSFDSPYPSSTLNESPITCCQYLADCSSDLIPFLYSNSQNVLSRDRPKKGFSDKEWPINGGEWNQPMQSYPELVLTGHADGSIKFWDMSGVNFDLISKMKTSKLFERPPSVAQRSINLVIETQASNQQQQLVPLDESNYLAVERIEYCATSRHLLVAGAAGQVIQFKLLNTKREQQQHQSDLSNNSSTATVLVEPLASSAATTTTTANSDNNQLGNQSTTTSTSASTPAPAPSPSRQHLLLKTRAQAATTAASSGAAGSLSSGGSSSSAATAHSSSQHRSNNRLLSGFHAELVCLTPSLIRPLSFSDSSGAESTTSALAGNAAAPIYLCKVPPKVIALAFQATHNILAFAHELGIVLVDTVQKCVILSATLHDLYGGASILNKNRDISIQPFATSSILQHHYQQQSAAAASNDFISAGGQVGGRGCSGSQLQQQQQQNNSSALDNGRCKVGLQNTTEQDNGDIDNGFSSSSVGAATVATSTTSTTQQQQQPTRSGADGSTSQRHSVRPLELETKCSQPLLSPAPSCRSTAPSPTVCDSSGAFGQFAGRSSRSQIQQDHHQQQQQQQYHHQAAVAAFDCSVSGGGANEAQTNNNINNRQLSINGKQLTTNNSLHHRFYLYQNHHQFPLLPASTDCLPGASHAHPLEQQPQPPPPQQTTSTTTHKSRFANSLFQRQLSTTALVGGGSGGNLTRPNSAGGSVGPSGRLFHRQATASQLTSSSGTADGLSNKQRAAALLAAARGEPAPATPTPKPAAGGGGKNKRIISRMLSISAIHTSSTNFNSTFEPDETVGGGGQKTSVAATNAMTNVSDLSNNDQAPDKIDSSFTRSRSSSSSSVAPTNSQANAADQQHREQQQETIQCLCFLDWQAAAANNQQQQQTSAANLANNKSLGSMELQNAQLALYLGTSSGCVLLLSLQMPDSEDNRVLQLQSVQAEPIPQAAVKLNGAILCIASFSVEPNKQLAPPGGSSCSSLESSLPELSGAAHAGGVPSGATSATGTQGTATSVTSAQQTRSSATDSSSHSSFDLSRAANFLAIVSDRQVRLYQLPVGSQLSATRTPEHQPQAVATGSSGASGANVTAEALADSPIARLLTNKANCVARTHLSDTSFACHSQLVQMRCQQPSVADETCLVTYLATGNVLVHSLPQLKPLLDADLVPYTDSRIGSSMLFSRQGHCLYQPSSSELCKFTVSSAYKAQVNEITGSLYVAREMPEMPRTNFFKSLFSAATSSSAASRQSERDELFGEPAAGKAQKGVAKHISSSGAAGTAAGLDKLKGATAGTLAHELRAAREGLNERGEKLGDIEDRTLAMLNQSEGYATAAHQLAQKFKDKKWYQF